MRIVNNQSKPANQGNLALQYIVPLSRFSEKAAFRMSNLFCYGDDGKNQGESLAWGHNKYLTDKSIFQ